MAFDAAKTPTVTAWTTFDELTPDQRARFGGYVLAKDRARAAGIANQAAQRRAEAALHAAKGNKSNALAMMLRGDA